MTEQDAPDYKYLEVESFDDGEIVRIMLDRPRQRNAQNRGLLVELNDAFMRAEADDTVRVVILGGNGSMFSSGHDLGSKDMLEEWHPGPGQHDSRKMHGGTRTGSEQLMLQEWHYFFQNTLRWRNLRKITVAQVHGPVFAAGLMLMWACDLITAAEGTEFADVVGTRLGMQGVEYFAHPWEFGPRKTKELLLTGDSMGVDEAHALGMVSKVFAEEELGDKTLDFARRIARTPTMAALLIKESVNQTTDTMGFTNALTSCFSMHQLNHSHYATITNGESWVGQPEHGVLSWKEAPPVTQALKDDPGIIPPRVEA